MKKLSIEEKAKRYDEALTKARNIVSSINVGLIGKDSFEAIFPELAESEDERIRKSLIILLQHFCKGYRVPGLDFPVSYKDMLAWLEKQGEQKSSWSEEDEKIIETMCKEGDLKPSEVQWLKSLKDRVQPQPKQEWSEEDERYLNNTISYLKDATEFKETAKLCIDWLKSLRPQNTWKPSNEQMLAIDTAINVIGKGTLSGKQLIELQEQLKKLREE